MTVFMQMPCHSQWQIKRSSLQPPAVSLPQCIDCCHILMTPKHQKYFAASDVSCSFLATFASDMPHRAKSWMPSQCVQYFCDCVLRSPIQSGSFGEEKDVFFLFTEKVEPVAQHWQPLAFESPRALVWSSVCEGFIVKEWGLSCLHLSKENQLRHCSGFISCDRGAALHPAD